MAERNSFTFVVPMITPASRPQAYTLCTRPRNAMNTARQTPCSAPMHHTVNRQISP